MLSVELERRLSNLPRDTFLGPTGFRTKALFKDHPQAEGNGEYQVFFIGKEKSSKDYISLKEVYMAIEDPTEYEFAMVVFGSYRHWLHIAELSWAKDHVAEWRNELQMKIKSGAIKGVVNLVDDDYTKETTKLQALKYLANSDYAEKITTSKAKKTAKKDSIAQAVSSEMSEDFKRLGITPLRSVK